MSARGRVSLPALPVRQPTGGIVDVLTGDAPVVAPVPAGVLSVEDAQELTQRIRQTARDVADRVTRLLQLVDQAIGGKAWRVLGYASAAAYIVDVVEPMRLDVEQRRLVVGWLSGRGMSTRAIAPLVSVAPKTITNDRRAIAASAEASEAGVESYTPTAPAKVTGLDGREYPAAPRPALAVVQESASAAGLVRRPASDRAGAFLDLLAVRLEESGRITVDDWSRALADVDRSASTTGRSALALREERGTARSSVVG